MLEIEGRDGDPVGDRTRGLQLDEFAERLLSRRSQIEFAYDGQSASSRAPRSLGLRLAGAVGLRTRGSLASLTLDLSGAPRRRWRRWAWSRRLACHCIQECFESTYLDGLRFEGVHGVGDERQHPEHFVDLSHS